MFVGLSTCRTGACGEVQVKLNLTSLNAGLDVIHGESGGGVSGWAHSKIGSTGRERMIRVRREKAMEACLR